MSSPNPLSEAPLLFCYDGSELAAGAIRRAATLMRARRAVVLHVHQNGSRPDVAESGRRIALDAGFEAVSAADAEPAPVADIVINEARRRGVAAIVVGSRARNSAPMPGSVSRALVQHSDLPVLVVPPEAEMTARATTEPIFICYDGSPEARGAIATAGDVLAGLTAIVAAFAPAVDDIIVLRATLPWPAGGEMQDRLARIDRQEAEGPLARAVEGTDSAAAAGLEARPDAIGGEGPAWQRLLGEAASEAAACIVTGHRRAVNPVASTAYPLVDHADRPVLVVPA